MKYHGSGRQLIDGLNFNSGYPFATFISPITWDILLDLDQNLKSFVSSELSKYTVVTL